MGIMVNLRVLKNNQTYYHFMNPSFIIGITGGSGSGKTTLIRKLRKQFSKKELCIISQDDYYYPKEKQVMDNKGIHNFDLPGAIDKKAFLKDIQLLKKGKVLKRKEYTFNNENAKPKIITLHPAKIIVVEGLFIFHFKKLISS